MEVADSSATGFLFIKTVLRHILWDRELNGAKKTLGKLRVTTVSGSWNHYPNWDHIASQSYCSMDTSLHLQFCMSVGHFTGSYQ